MENKKILYVIDGNSLLFRAYYATSWAGADSIMRNSKGEPTNAIFAFGNMFIRILSSFTGGESVFVAFDAENSSATRKAEFEDYKANRAPCPEDLIPQFPMSREMLDALGITHYEQGGIEADDIAGTIAKKAAKLGYSVVIYTSDKDYLQLVDENITVTLLKKGLSEVQEVNPSTMVESFGFEPKQIIDFKGLRGDSSDNLPGIPGVGDKTAVKLIQEYGSFDAIVEAAKSGKLKGKVASNIVENEELGRKCYRLATILTEEDLPVDIDSLLYEGYDFAKVSEFANRYELKQFLSRIPPKLSISQENIKAPDVEIVKSFKGIDLGKKIGLSADIDSSSYHDQLPAGIAIATNDKIYYEYIEDAQEDESLKIVLEDASIDKSCYDCKKIKISLEKIGIELKGIAFDMLLACYLLDSSLSDSPKLCFSLFGVDIESGEQKEASLFDVAESSLHGNIAYYSLALEKRARKKLEEEGATYLFDEVELPLASILADMEKEGFPLDGRKLKEIGQPFYEKRDEWERICHERAGKMFSPASPKQVATLLFDELHLGNGKKKGTSAEILKDLVDEHPVVEAILQYRKYAKLCSTYIDGLLPHIKEDGKIHSVFHQAQTSTGRLSSSNPNLQNISTRDEESKTIRKAFYYKDDLYIMSLDYAQIELRLLAALAKCQPYIDVFASGRDVHQETARKIFHIPDGVEVPHDLRRKAKAVNFAIIYGTSAFGLAEQMDTYPKKAAEMITSFYEAYPEIREYLDSEVEKATKLGYATTMFGRKRHLRDLSDPNYAKREAARRAAMNAPVQGSAADLLKIAMIAVDRFLKEKGCKCKMVLTIHDELLFALPEEEIDDLFPQIQKIMENAVELPVKLFCEGSAGKTWYEAKD